MDHLPAAVWSARFDRWEIVWLKAETTIDEGSFVLTGDHKTVTGYSTRFPVAEYKPGRDGTHTPLGPHELEEAELRDRPAGTEPP